MLRLVTEARFEAALGSVAAPATPSAAAIARDFRDPYLECVRLLREASEIEHALMVQYLYAAFSVRPEFEGIAGEADSAGDGLLAVAIQEMQHLSAVSRTLVALGAEPNLRSQDFPYQIDLYPFPMNLERLSRASIAKYVYAEAPAGYFDVTEGHPDPEFAKAVRGELGKLKVNHIGSMYLAIIAALKEVQTSPPFKLPDLTSRIEALEEVKAEGEAAHFQLFVQLFKATHSGFGGASGAWSENPDSAKYPSMPVAKNPIAIPGHPDVIPDSALREIAWIADLHYWAINILVDLSFRFPAAAYLTRAMQHMRKSLFILGNLLASRGQGAPFDPLSTGYSPAPTDVGTRRFLVQLLLELQRLEDSAKANLPKDYPFNVTTETVNAIRTLGV